VKQIPNARHYRHSLSYGLLNAQTELVTLSQDPPLAVAYASQSQPKEVIVCDASLFDSVALDNPIHGLVEPWGCAMQGFRNAARVCVSIAAITAMFASSVEAVTLSNAEGAVYVNHGDGFQPAGAGTALSSGDRVRVGSGGSVNIVYENGCSTRVGSSQVTVVLATPPSCQGARLKDGGLVVGAGVGIGDGLKDGPTGFGTDTLIAGGLVVGAGVGIAVAVSNNDNNSVSP
jgi:hypothetical protein